MNSGGLIKIQYRSYSMNSKITHALAGAILLGGVTAITVFLSVIGGYWLVAISAVIGAYAGTRVVSERRTAGFDDIPDDWYEDVGPTDEYFGKTKTKH